MNGKLIVLEGIDGAGKSTQARLLAERLSRLNLPVQLLPQPGGTWLGERLRLLLLSREGESSSQALHPLAELFLFAADRAQLTYEKVLPALQNGWWVIQDRGADSSLVYQGGKAGVRRSTVRIINRYATAGLTPHLTIILDLPVEIALKRLNRPPDRMEGKGAEFLSQVRTAYLTLARKQPERYVVVDAQKPLEAVCQAIWEAVRLKFSLSA